MEHQPPFAGAPDPDPEADSTAHRRHSTKLTEKTQAGPLVNKREHLVDMMPTPAVADQAERFLDPIEKPF